MVWKRRHKGTKRGTVTQNPVEFLVTYLLPELRWILILFREEIVL